MASAHQRTAPKVHRTTSPSEAGPRETNPRTDGTLRRHHRAQLREYAVYGFGNVTSWEEVSASVMVQGGKFYASSLGMLRLRGFSSRLVSRSGL